MTRRVVVHGRGIRPQQQSWMNTRRNEGREKNVAGRRDDNSKRSTGRKIHLSGTLPPLVLSPLASCSSSTSLCWLMHKNPFSVGRFEPIMIYRWRMYAQITCRSASDNALPGFHNVPASYLRCAQNEAQQLPTPFFGHYKTFPSIVYFLCATSPG